MAKVEKYRACIEQLITEYGHYKPSYGDVETQLIFDREHDHYQLSRFGWNKDRRIRNCALHFDIKDGKIWVQHNGTESDIAEELVGLGVSKEDIVLAFHPPYKRVHTRYAVG
jgi:hypothetical protein